MKLIAWDSDNPGLSAIPLKPQYEAVRAQFQFDNVIELGSQTQCGCGFIDQNEDTDDPRRRTVADLRAYLEEALRSAPELEMFACWEGGESEEPVARVKVHPSAFNADTFPIGDDVHARAGYARIAL